MSKLQKTVCLALAAFALVASPLAQPASGAALVVKDEPCAIDAGDIPGLPALVLDSSRVAILPNGGLVATCQGTLPEGVSLSTTFQGEVRCFDGVNTYTGHILATRSGQVSVVCRFPAP